MDIAIEELSHLEVIGLISGMIKSLLMDMKARTMFNPESGPMTGAGLGSGTQGDKL